MSLLNICRAIDKKRETKYNKQSDNERNFQDMAGVTKESLYQKFANREVKSNDRPVSLFIVTP